MPTNTTFNKQCHKKYNIHKRIYKLNMHCDLKIAIKLNACDVSNTLIIFIYFWNYEEELMFAGAEYAENTNLFDIL